MADTRARFGIAVWLGGAFLAGCGGGNSSPVVPNPALPTPTKPGNPFVTTRANVRFSQVSADFNGIAAPLAGGNGSFARRRSDTTDGLDATLNVGNDPIRNLTVDISTAGNIRVGQRFALGVSDDFSSSTGVSYSEIRADQTQLWSSQGGPDVAGSITVVALSETLVSLRFEGLRLSRREGNGPPASGSFTLSGELTLPRN